MISAETHTTLSEIATALSISKNGAEKRARRQGWSYIEEPAKGGLRRWYPIATLPKDIQAAIKTHRLALACNRSKEELNENARAGRLIGRQLRDAHETAERDAKLKRQQAGIEIMARWPKLTDNQVARMLGRHAIVQAYSEWLKTQQGKSSAASPKGVYKPRKIIPGNKTLKTFADSYNTTGGACVSKEVNALIRKISGSNLRRWVDGFARLGLAGILDEKDGKWRAGHGKVEDQEEIKTLVIGLLVEFPHITNKHIEDAICARFGARLADVNATLEEAQDAGLLARPSVTAISRFREEFLKKHGSAYLAIRDPDRWKDTQMLAFGDASGDVTHPNYRWEMDSTPGDILLVDLESASGTARYHVIGVMDVWSRRGKLLVAKSSRAVAIGSLIRRAIMDWGVPERRKADNGADYQSNYLNRFFDAIGTEREDCAPFSGWQKAHIERLFRTFNHDLVELLPGYIGHNVDERKELEARASFSERLFDKNGTLEVSMTADELQKFCDTWCESVYAHNQTAGLDGMTPFAKMATWNKPIKRIKDERALDVLLAPLAGSNKGWFSLQKKGIRINKAWYSAPELGRCAVGDRLSVSQDVADMGRVFVFDTQGEFVCIAQNPELTGISMIEMAGAAKAIQNNEIKEQKAALKKVAAKASVKNIAHEILRQRAEQSGKLRMLQQAGTGYTTPGIDAAGKAACASETPTRSLEADRLIAEMRQRRIELNPKAPILQMPSSPLDSASIEQKFDLWHECDSIVRSGGELADERMKRFYERFPQSTAFKALHKLRQEESLSTR